MLPQDVIERIAPLVLASVFTAAVAVAQSLVFDFNQAPATTSVSSHAKPVAVAGNGFALFVADVPGYGEELWSTDGTPAGTQLLADIQPGYRGSFPQRFATTAGGLVFFMAETDGFGSELWCSDGTPQGTRLTRDIRPGPEGSNPIHLTPVGSAVVLFADDGIHGEELWRSDGTPAGTNLVLDINPSGGIGNGSRAIGAFASNEAIFGARVGGVWQLWRSDLTASGTIKIMDLPSSAQTIGAPHSFASFGSRVLFEYRLPSNSSFAFVTDGTAAGTLSLGVDPRSSFQVAGGLAFFAGDDREVWRTDGTVAGTFQAFDLTPGFANFTSPGFLGSIGSTVLFLGTKAGQRSLFRTDGTPAGTHWLANVMVGSLPGLVDGGSSSLGSIWFAGLQNGVARLWTSDGTMQGTYALPTPRVLDVLAYGNGALFAADEATIGVELWASDGTTGGTRVVADLVRRGGTMSSNVDVIGTFRGEAVVVADAGAGSKVWLSDGTRAHTRAIASLPSSPTFFARSASTGSFLFVLPGVLSSFAFDPLVYDGSGQMQTLPVSTQAPGFLPQSPPVSIGDRVVFAAKTSASPIEPWVSDGTLAGTQSLGAMPSGAAVVVQSEFFAWRGHAYFRGFDPVAGIEPWRTDGTAGGTELLVDIAPGGAGVSFVEWAPLGDVLYFRALSSPTDARIWRFDRASGSAGSLDLASLGLSMPLDLHAVGARLAMRSVDSGGVRRLVVSDGTLAGTQVLSQSFEPETLLPISADRLLMSATTPSGTSYWTTDGTVNGTINRGALLPGAIVGSSSRLTRDRIVVLVDDPIVGRELYTTDGTPAGTYLLFDLAPGDSNASDLVRAGTSVLFGADDGTHGRELFALHVRLLQDDAVASFGFGCPAPGKAPPTIAVAGGAGAGGGSVAVVVPDAPANASVLFALADSIASVPIAGCTIWLGGVPAVAVEVADTQGRAVVGVPVTPALFGLRFVAQAFVVDANGPLLGLLSATAGLEVVLGP
ncbi:MAG: hypothetical protein AB8H80_22550 [Planctomycetota bacterium]